MNVSLNAVISEDLNEGGYYLEIYTENFMPLNTFKTPKDFKEFYNLDKNNSVVLWSVRGDISPGIMQQVQKDVSESFSIV